MQTFDTKSRRNASRARAHHGVLAALFLTSAVMADPQAADGLPGLAIDGYRTIPVQRLISGHQLIQARINWRDVNLVVDTGAEQLVIANEGRSALGIDPSDILERDQASGIAGPFEYTRHPLDSLVVQGMPIDVDSIMATELGPFLNGLSQATGVEVSGILGQAELLAHDAVLEVEPDRLHLRMAGAPRVAPETGFVDPGRYRAISMTALDNGLRGVTARIEDHDTHLLLDTGASRTVLDRGHVEHWGLADLGRNGSVGGAGDAHRAQIRQHSIDRLAIGGAPIELDQVASIDFHRVTQMLLERGGASLHGVVGLDVLRRHRAVIDLGADRIHLFDLAIR